jgi:hypothetical protein
MAYIHENFGAVVAYPHFGLACADCGYDAHPGNCRYCYCQTCGTECCESGCSLHHGRPRIETTPRKTQP